MIDPGVKELIEFLVAVLIGGGVKYAVDKRKEMKAIEESSDPQIIERRVELRRGIDVEIKEALRILTEEFKAADATHEEKDEKRFHELSAEGKEEKQEILSALKEHEEREREMATFAENRRTERAKEFADHVNSLSARIDGLSLRIDGIVGKR